MGKLAIGMTVRQGDKMYDYRKSRLPFDCYKHLIPFEHFASTISLRGHHFPNETNDHYWSSCHFDKYVCQVLDLQATVFNLS
jgi:hypothetical protein